MNCLINYTCTCTCNYIMPRYEQLAYSVSAYVCQPCVFFLLKVDTVSTSKTACSMLFLVEYLYICMYMILIDCLDCPQATLVNYHNQFAVKYQNYK